MEDFEYIQVIVPAKLQWEPYYKVPKGRVRKYGRVKVLLGKTEYVAVVSGTGVTPKVKSLDKIKEIVCVCDELPDILPGEIELWRKVAQYYMCTVGEVYKAAYPLLKSEHENSKPHKAGGKAASKGFPVLSDAQDKARQELEQAFSQGKPALLCGVTGSGKTEVYISLALKALEEGRDVLYLVPEIAVSRQGEQRLREYFGEKLLCFHSGKTAAFRGEVTRLVRDASGPHIVLGTRSAVFLPWKNLGLIIVDEEHDSSYKQDSPAPRYNGRNVALMLGKIHEGCKVIMGSATPSLDSLYNYKTGKYALVKLSQKYYGGEENEVTIIDTRAERRKRGMNGSISKALIARMTQVLDAGGQIMVLKARRGFATYIQCEECGKIAKCPRCSVAFTFHKDINALVCPGCGYKSYKNVSQCSCGGSLRAMGYGVQKVEEELCTLFPDRKIARLDSDVSTKAHYQEEVISGFEKGEIDILVGTQMISKGFDFSRLRLVAVIGADGLLALNDFRADEKAFQLLDQFRGRCGRRGEKGELVVQTAVPDHPVYKRLALPDSPSLASTLLKEREMLNLPPYCRIIDIMFTDTNAPRREKLASELSCLLGAKGADIMSSYSPSERLSLVRVRISRSDSAATGKYNIETLVEEFITSHKYPNHININVDPV